MVSIYFFSTKINRISQAVVGFCGFLFWVAILSKLGYTVDNMPWKRRSSMKEVYTEIVSDIANLWESIDYKKLRNYTRKCPQSFSKSIAWENIEHLHILGSSNSEYLADTRGGIERGAYVNAEHTWLLLIGPTVRQIANCLKACCSALKLLDIRFTTVTKLDLRHLTQLKELNLSYNESLLEVFGLHEMSGLMELDLCKTSMRMPLDIRNMQKLSILNISRSPIPDIIVDSEMSQLVHLQANNSCITNSEFLKYTPAVHWLDLSGCDIDSLPYLSCLTKLQVLLLSGTRIDSVQDLGQFIYLQALYLDHTRIVSIDGIGALENLSTLSLAGTLIQTIPEDIQKLKNLHKLDLSSLMLSDIPNWLPELGLRFRQQGNTGLFLRGTVVHGVDSSIFGMSHEMIVEWFKNRSSDDQVTVNELKVVFLGDGEAGKSHTIARLMNNGGDPEGYDGAVTPGIAIYNKDYDIDGRKIRVHFWDFGGQEILHSMHRIFMTKRTLYVVLVNARDNTQDERARFWLHNITSFAKDARIMIVLNKMDQNPNASINETELHYRFPQLCSVTKLSALMATQEQFNFSFADRLRQEIGSFKTLQSAFVPAWQKIKDEIWSMQEPYMTGEDYIELCLKHNVRNPNTMATLLDWFNDLGVSFTKRDWDNQINNTDKYSQYSLNPQYGEQRMLNLLRQKVVLYPRWITNAIYIILFNKHASDSNGLISRSLIHKLLGTISSDIQRVIPDLTYTPKETEFVLSIIRQFRLSYPFSNEYEFMPMLCQRNSMPVAVEYAEDPRTLEFRIIYEYLPNNVIHRLMVDRWYDLELDHIWLTGALFSMRGSSDVSAVVRIEGNVLRINVRCDSSRDAASAYCQTLRNDIENISNEMTLTIKERQIAYKDAGIVEYFDYDELNGCKNYGMEVVYSKKHKKLIRIDDILNQVGGDDYKERMQLNRDLQRVMSMMQADRMQWDSSEDDRICSLRDALVNMRYFIGDQCAGSMNGMPDLDIRKERNSAWTVLEALTVRGANSTQIDCWNIHLNRMLDHAGFMNIDFLNLVCFVEVPRDRYSQIVRAFGNHLQNYAPEGAVLDARTESLDSDGNFYLNVFRCTYKVNSRPIDVYHYFVRIGI